MKNGNSGVYEGRILTIHSENSNLASGRTRRNGPMFRLCYLWCCSRAAAARERWESWWGPALSAHRTSVCLLQWLHNPETCLIVSHEPKHGPLFLSLAYTFIPIPRACVVCCFVCWFSFLPASWVNRPETRTWFIQKVRGLLPDAIIF